MIHFLFSVNRILFWLKTQMVGWKQSWSNKQLCSQFIVQCLHIFLILPVHWSMCQSWWPATHQSFTPLIHKLLNVFGVYDALHHTGSLARTSSQMWSFKIVFISDLVLKTKIQKQIHQNSYTWLNPVFLLLNSVAGFYRSTGFWGSVQLMSSGQSFSLSHACLHDDKVEICI